MTIRFPGYRLFLGVAALSAAILAVAFFLEYGLGMEPCPLCWVQRWVFMVLGAVSLAALLHRPRAWGGRIYAGLLGVVGAAGMTVALRHIQVQLDPPVLGCGVGWSTMVDRLPFHELFLRALAGSADCARVDAFLGIPLPWWTMAAFTSIAGVALAQATGALKLR